ncbi:MAG TPA: hypothetical protein VG826_32895 [Pirellulales bacterium]|nr:hypothetical protein [Pirellulales bacterium]
MTSLVNYFQTLAVEFGRGWNRFWFAPSDPMTLGLLRIATGLVALYVVAAYSPDLDRYFGSDGLVPLEMVRDLEAKTRDGNRQFVPFQVREAMPREYRFSYLDRVHTVSGLRIVHACGLLTLSLFTCGLFTRLTAVGSLVVVLSYLHRAPMLTSQVEPILAFVLFYLCLGPAGAACSLDRWRATRRNDSAESTGCLASTWATVSLRLIQVHLTLVYVMMAVGKVWGNVWWDGMAMWFLIARTERRMVDLTGLHSLPLVVHAWSYAVMFWQAAFPVLVWNRLARPLLLGINALMWALLAPVIGNVPLAVMMVVASVAFVPGDLIRSAVGGRHRSQAALQATTAA